MILFEVSEKNIPVKILDILFNEKLQITHVLMQPTLKTVCKVHAPDY